MEYLTQSHFSLALLHQMLFLSKYRLNGNCFDDFSKYNSSTSKDVTPALMEKFTLSSTFPNLVTLAKIVSILSVATATVKSSFSSIPKTG